MGTLPLENRKILYTDVVIIGGLTSEGLTGGI